MFKRPRGSNTEVVASPRMIKRLKEDNISESAPVHAPAQREDYVNLTFPSRSSSMEQLHDLRLSQDSQLSDSAGSNTGQDLLHYNRLKLQHRTPNSKYEIKTVQCYANQCESDNSSLASELTDASSELDSLESREREHYNKLKVDVRNIKSNKKLMRGIQVLNEQSLFRGHISSSALLLNRSTQRLAKVADGVSDRYRKEGHVNRLYSVVDYQDSALHKSRSTGDILQMSQECAREEQVQERVPQLTHSRSVYNMEYSERATPSPPPTHLSSPRKHSRVSPLIHTQQSLGQSHLDTSFMSKVITFPCTHEGREINSAIYDFTVNIAKGTVRKRKSIEFQVGVCTHGPFVFPRGYKLVSPIIMVISPTQTKLKKPVEIIISHCIDLIRPGHEKENLTFFRARRRESKGQCSPKYYMENTEDSSNVFQIHNNHGTLTSTELGFFCIMSRENTSVRKHTNYCLVPVVPKNVESSSWKVHYCVTYHLQAYVMEIKEHFGPNWETLPPKPFQLETRVGTQNREKIKIHFSRTLPESGWVFTLDSDNKVQTSDIDSWISRRHRDKAQPPCFTLRVCGDYATSSSATQVWFTGPGMAQDLTTEIKLPLINPPAPSVAESPVSESLSSLSSTSILLSSAVGSLLSNSEYDHLPPQEDLDQTHIQLTYHNGQIDFLTDEDIEGVACEVIRAVDTDWVKLTASLDIPSHILLEIFTQKTIQLQVVRLLKEWRQHSTDCSKEELARCLRSTDARLRAAAAYLMGHRRNH